MSDNIKMYVKKMYRDKVDNMQSWTVVLAALKLPAPFISELVTDRDNIKVNIYAQTYETGFLINNFTT
jgi:hypothetical protein